MGIKNIVIVSYDYLPNIGGIAVYTHALSKALIDRGHRVTVLTCYKSMSSKIKFEYTEGIEVFRIPIMDIKKIGDWQYRRRMSRFINQLQEKRTIDVIHWQTMNKDGKMMRKVSVQGVEIYTNHISWFRMLFNERKFAKIKSLIGNPDYIICTSREIREMTKQLFGEFTCNFISNGVELKNKSISKQTIQDLKSELGINSEDKVVLTTNRMEPIKGMSYFVKAIPKLLSENEDLFICLIGDGSEEGNLKKWLADQKIDFRKVKFLGRKTNEEVRELLELADIYVQPSLMEGTSIAIMEAMACGKPVIACDIGGNPDILNHMENGLLIVPKDSEAIIQAVNYLIENPDVAIKMGGHGMEKVEKELSWSTLVEQVEIVYDKAIEIKLNGK